MGNYDQMLAFGRRLFLEWDQQTMINRYHLQADAAYLYINYLGQPHRVCRSTAKVDNLVIGQPAAPTAALSIFDYLCRDNWLPGMSGRLLPVNAMKHVAQSSPDTVSLHRPHALKFQNKMPLLRQAIDYLGFDSFPQGDISCRFPVFDGFTTVFQFWEGDDEFEPTVRFLWDENALSYLRYETTYYVMGDFLKRIYDSIAEIEKNVK